MNSLLHTAGRSSINHQELLSRISHHMNILLRQCRQLNSQHIHLALDGPASFYKILAQQKRRSENARAAMIRGTMDCSCFTPGTLIMSRIEDFLLQILRKWKQNHPLLSVTISGSSVLGEGESKIFQHIRRINSNDSNLIFIRDSDAILHSMANSNRRILLMHPPWEYSSIDSLFLSKRFIDSVHQFTTSNLPVEQILNDLILMALLTGSDHTPGIPNTSMHRLWSIYLTMPKSFQGLLRRKSNHLEIDRHQLAIFAHSYCSQFKIQNRRESKDSSHHISRLIWAASQIFQIPCPLPVNSDYIVPSMHDFANFESETSPNQSHSTLDLEILPAAAAILTLDFSYSHSFNYIPNILHPMARIMATKRQSSSTTIDDCKQVVDHIYNLSKDRIPLPYHRCIFPQSPQTLLPANKL